MHLGEIKLRSGHRNMMRKLKVLLIFAATLIFIVAASTGADSIARANEPGDISLLSGKRLRLPNFPGMVRVDGLFPEVDLEAYFLIQSRKPYAAIFCSSQEMWAKFDKNNVFSADKLDICADNFFTTMKLQDARDKIAKMLERRVSFGNIPDSAFFRMSTTENEMNISGYTILDHQIITFRYSAYNSSGITDRWSKKREIAIQTWVDQIRKLNIELTLLNSNAP
jgi:hypothetical protein